MLMVSRRFKTYFVTGLLAFLPIIFTVYIIRVLIVVTNNMLVWIPLSPTKLWYIDLVIKIFIIMLLILLIGFLVSNLITRRYFVVGERLVNHIPFIKTLYGASKKFLEALTIQRKGSFSSVVMLEYPRKGVYTLGLATKSIQQSDPFSIFPKDIHKKELVSVFIPTVPVPASGLLILVPKKELIYLDVTVEEGIKMIVSGGVLEAKKRKSL